MESMGGWQTKILADCEKDLDKAEKAKSNAASMCDKAKQGKAKGSDTDKAKKELDDGYLSSESGGAVSV